MNDPLNFDQGQAHPKPARFWIVRIGAVALLTLSFYVWLSRGLKPIRPQPWAELPRFVFNPELLGLSMPSAALSVAALYFLNAMPFFQRIVGKQAKARDTLWMFLGFSLLLLLMEVYSFSFARLMRYPVMTNLVVVIAGGLIGGWRVGLGLGLLAALIRGMDEGVQVLVNTFREMLYRVEGPNALEFVLHFHWGEWFLGHWVDRPYVLSPLWVGPFAGLCADLLGRARFSPLAAILLGGGLDLATFFFIAIRGGPPGPGFTWLSAAVTGLATGVVALMIRNVQARAVQRRAAAAELARTQAELRALRSQINPHFLFNAINTIRYFIRTDPDTARRLLLDLSDIFQRVLRAGEFIALQDEIAYVEAYLALEKARLGERLTVTWDMPDDSLLDCAIPTLILQPVVENAVIHGIAQKPSGGTVRIAALNKAGDLVLRVEDDGVGLAPALLSRLLEPGAESGNSIGLRNVDGRLRVLYGDGYGLKVTSEPGQGTCVEIKVPIDRPPAVLVQ